MVYKDLQEKLSCNWEKDLDTENINFVTPELLGVDPKFIRAFVTEKGVAVYKRHRKNGFVDDTAGSASWKLPS